MKSQPIPYKDTKAMPGSDLYRFLSEGKADKAEQCYQETEKRHRKLLGLDSKEQHVQSKIK